MTEIWDLLPVWLKWVLFVSGWTVAVLQNLWRKLPDNLYVFGVMLRRARTESHGTIEWSDDPKIAWGDDAKGLAHKPDNHSEKG